METIQKRQIAYKVSTKELTSGEYVKESGWLPNYILIRGMKVSRVNIVGVIVGIEELGDKKEILLEDRMGRISIRSFEPMEMIKKLNVGDVVKVIGRPREFNNEKYVVPEIIKKIAKGWFELRVLELSQNVSEIIEKTEEKTLQEREENVVEKELGIESKKIKEEKISVEEEIIKNNIDPEEVIKQIKILDKGDGADYEDVLNKVKDEKMIQMLLEDGEIFEIKPGKLKLL